MKTIALRFFILLVMFAAFLIVCAAIEKLAMVISLRFAVSILICVICAAVAWNQKQK